MQGIYNLFSLERVDFIILPQFLATTSHVPILIYQR
jgi:hypothetical protein